MKIVAQIADLCLDSLQVDAVGDQLFDWRIHIILLICSLVVCGVLFIVAETGELLQNETLSHVQQRLRAVLGEGTFTQSDVLGGCLACLTHDDAPERGCFACS